MPAVETGVRIEGLRELVRDLERLGVEVDDLKDVMASISRLGAQEIQVRAPRVSGALAGTVRGNRAKGKAVVTVGNARVPYAGVIAWGWPARNIKPDGFVPEGVDSITRQVPEIFEDGIDKLIQKRGMQ